MAFYFAIGVAAALLMCAADRCESHGNKLFSLILYCGVALLFSHFAGARDITVGTDTTGYALNSYYAVKYYGMDYFWYSSVYADLFAPLFKVLCIISVTLTQTFYGYLFAIEFLTVIPVILASRKMLGRWSWMGILVFSVLFYPMSFNMMRQMIAMGFLLLAFIEIAERKPVIYCAYTVIACLFHSSAIVGLLIYPLVVFARGRERLGGFKLAIVCMVGIAFVFIAPSLIKYLPGNHYQNYLSGEYAMDGGLRMPAMTALLAVNLAAFSWTFIRKCKPCAAQSELLIEMAVVVTFGIVCLMLSLFSFYLYRIGFFFLYVSILLLPLLCSSINDRNSSLFMTSIVILLICVWAFDYYAIQSAHEVVPYVLSANCL